MDAHDRLRRTRLYCPGNSPAMVQNAGIYGADSIIFDLEDSVAVTEKDAARNLVRNALMSLNFGRSERTVRINSPDTPYFTEDLRAIVPARPDAIVLPKAETAEGIEEVSEQIGKLEEEFGIESGSIAIMPIIESARGVLNAEKIATAPRVVAISPGGEDLTADLGVERTRDGEELAYIKSRLALAASAAKIQVLDTVFSAVTDEEGLIAATKRSIQMGFHGKAVIHPTQIGPVHDAFMPSDSDIYKARKVVQAYDQAMAAGQGVISVDGKMIDVPVYNRMKRILQRAAAGGVITR